MHEARRRHGHQGTDQHRDREEIAVDHDRPEGMDGQHDRDARDQHAADHGDEPAFRVVAPAARIHRPASGTGLSQSGATASADRTPSACEAGQVDPAMIEFGRPVGRLQQRCWRR